MVILFLIVIGAIVIAMFILGYASGDTDNKKKKIFRGLKFAFGTIIILIIIFSINILDYKEDESIWNSGFCPTCHEHWEFKNKYTEGRISNEEHYCYICPECKDLIELHHYEK